MKDQSHFLLKLGSFCQLNQKVQKKYNHLFQVDRYKEYL
jgi:hypothetical protein